MVTSRKMKEKLTKLKLNKKRKNLRIYNPKVKYVKKKKSANIPSKPKAQEKSVRIKNIETDANESRNILRASLAEIKSDHKSPGAGNVRKHKCGEKEITPKKSLNNTQRSPVNVKKEAVKQS